MVISHTYIADYVHCAEFCNNDVHYVHAHSTISVIVSLCVWVLCDEILRMKGGQVAYRKSLTDVKYCTLFLKCF